MSGFLPSDYSSASPAHPGAPPMPPTQYIFPMLKNAEILTCCSELEVELTKAELTEPQRHKDRIRKVFWHLLEICFGITEEDLAKQLPTPQKLAEISDYPELHEEHLIDVLFFKELTKCMRVVGIHDFSWKDLLQPTAKRFRCQMSAILNMAKFREEQLRKYYELMEPRNELVNALQEVHHEHQLLLQQLQKAQQESNEKMGEIDAAARECQELESEIAKANKLQAAKREEAAALKREVNDLKDQLASVNWALQEAQAEEEHLKSRIVSSPARRKRELADKEHELEQEKKEGEKLDAELEHLDSEIERFQRHIKALEKLNDMVQQLHEDVVKHKNLLSDLEKKEKKVAANQAQIQEINEKADEVQRELMRVEERINLAHKQAKMQMDAANDRLEIAKEQLILAEKERHEYATRIEEKEAEVRDLEEQIKADELQTEETIAQVISEYKEMEKAFLMRHERRMQFIEAGMS